MLGAHVRLLLAIPLLFLAESKLDPRVEAFLRRVADTRTLPGDAVSTLMDTVAASTRWTKSAWPDLLCLLIALSLRWLAPYASVPGLDSSAHLAEGAGRTLSGAWYSLVCLTVLQFLILRWLFRLALWWHFLWSLSRLPLRLVAGHADGMGGIAGLDVVVKYFAPLALAISAVWSASFAADIAVGAMALEAVLSAAAAILLLDALLFLTPLLFFSPRLLACKREGEAEYMELAERYGSAFEQRWLRGKFSDEQLLGSPDIQSLADLNSAVTIARDLRIIPVSRKTLVALAFAALLPLAPLALFKYPLATLAAQLVGRLIGL
jgi:hypothetical protein